MIDQLRIKCPSCGIVLDVRNSKHEAVKQIACPNCQKRLAVNFEDAPAASEAVQVPIDPLYYGELRIELQLGLNCIPMHVSDKVEIKVVRLQDGNYKCLVSPLSDDASVKVNDQVLHQEEQMALSKGDILKIDKIVLSYAQPTGLLYGLSAKEPEKEQPVGKDVCPKERNFVWLYASIAGVILMLSTILLWPSEPQKALGEAETNRDSNTVKPIDSIKTLSQKQTENDDKPTRKIDEQKSAKPAAKGRETRPSDFDLEKRALNGDVEAQFVLGNRLVHGSGFNTVLRGIKYLQMAARNGHRQAAVVLDKAILALSERAGNGDETADGILKSIGIQ